MEIAGIIAIICLGGSMALLALGGALLIPVDNHLHPGNSHHH